MPEITVRITPEQAAELALGNPIKVEASQMPLKPSFSIIVMSNGNVYKCLTTDVRAQPHTNETFDVHFWNGALIAKGPHHEDVGHVQDGGGTALSITEVPA